MLTPWTPERRLQNWRSELDDFFSGPFNGQQCRSPAVDIEETDDTFVIRADLPGLREEEIEVKLHDDLLTISGERGEQTGNKEGNKEVEEGGMVLRERRHGAFQRQFRLGNKVEPDGVKAAYTNGVLCVELPKKATAKPRQIPLTVH